MSLLKKAANGPTRWPSAVVRPGGRACAPGRLPQCLYIGANTLAAPIARPLAILAAMEDARARRVSSYMSPRHLYIYIKKEKRMRFIEARMSGAGPESRRACLRRRHLRHSQARPKPRQSRAAAWVQTPSPRALEHAPLMTPLSKPKRKPPIAATQESAIYIGGTVVWPGASRVYHSEFFSFPVLKLFYRLNLENLGRWEKTE